MAIKRTIVVDEKKETVSKTTTSKTSNKTNKESKTASSIQDRLLDTELVHKQVGVNRREKRVFNPKGKILIIVESPAKSKTIEKFLGDGYLVKASMGHLRDLPKNQLGVDIDHDFMPRYSNLLGRKKLIDELSTAADKASSVLLATDPDREGEAISWHLSYILNLDEAAQNRITFNEITEQAVHGAISKARKIDMDMVDAQQARRVLDRLVGYKLSPLLWKKICKGLSAGRVQSVAVRLICEREREILAFIPKEYWSIDAVYEGIDTGGEKVSFTASLTHIKNEKVSHITAEMAQEIKNHLEGQMGIVKNVTKRKRLRRPAPPFTTSTLQQDGVRKLNFGAKKTMMLAQHLYEGKEVGSYGHVGLITYMRTDSTRIAKEMSDDAREFIHSVYGPSYYPNKPNQYGKNESAQDAHEAIRPTSLGLTPQVVSPYLNRDELRLYTLIWNRFIASQMAPQESESVAIKVSVQDYELKAVGSKVLFKGFTEVYEDEKTDESNEMPLLSTGETVTNKTVQADQHFTQPPPRYSEASLIKMLEEKGIGRPSTYAPIMDTIQSRNYVERKDKQFIPTELGFTVVDFLVDYFESIINVDFTAALEKELDSIAEGKETYLEVLQGFYGAFQHELQAADEVEKIKVTEEPSDEICEKCGHPMIYKYGRFGKFLACSNFPECQNTKAIVHSIGVTCPVCKVGDIIERKSKRGRTFYGCSTYPACDFVTWDKPIDEFCSTCGAIMVEKTYKNGTVKKFCSNSHCQSRQSSKKSKESK